LDKCFGGDGSHRTDDVATLEKDLMNWGGSYGGDAIGSSMNNVGSTGYYWSATENGSDAYNLTFNSGGLIYPQRNLNRYYGFQVRCVIGVE
jgi:hypothetical protein